MLLAGPDDARVRELADPDGDGPEVAPVAAVGGTVYRGLRNRVQACTRRESPCDQRMFAADAALAALDWFMDRSRTSSLEFARERLARVDELAFPGSGFACDRSRSDCGVPVAIDERVDDLVYLALTYTLIRDQLVDGERSRFARKMLHGWDAPCRNQLQPTDAAEAKVVDDGRAVVGRGLDAIAPGTRVYLVPEQGRGWWAEVVEGGSERLELAAPVGGFDAEAATEGRAVSIAVVADWNQETCGYVWVLLHGAQNPRGRTLGFSEAMLMQDVGVDASVLEIAAGDEFPDRAPFALSIAGREVVEVTAIEGDRLQVRRGRFATTRQPAAAGTPVYFTRALPNVGTMDFSAGAVAATLFAYASVGSALAGDDPVAERLVDVAVDDWLTLVEPKNRDMWTGFHQGGSGSTGVDRQLTSNAGLTLLTRNLQGTPSLDRSEGGWLRNAVAAFLYTTLPDEPARSLPWGPPAQATSPDFFAHRWAPLLVGIYGAGGSESAAWNFWQRQVASEFRADVLGSARATRWLPMAVLFFRADDPISDYREAYPRQRFFGAVDGNPSHALATSVSRTGWREPDDTLLYTMMFSAPWTPDPDTLGAPTAYKIYKRGWLLTENGANDTGVGLDTNMPVFGDEVVLTKFPLVATVNRMSDEESGSFTYFQINNQAAYHARMCATRVARSVVHLKKVGTRDYVIVYDTLLSFCPKTKSIRMHFDKPQAETSVMSSSALPRLVWTGADRRLSTEVVLPRPGGVVAKYESLPRTHRVTLCVSADGATCDDENLESAFLIVHGPSADPRDEMPEVRLLDGVTSGFVAVQIAGADPKVAVFPADGTPATEISFRSTHQGTAQALITGLKPGVYDVDVDGATACGAVDVRPSQEAVYCELPAGEVTARRRAPN